MMEADILSAEGMQCDTIVFFKGKMQHNIDRHYLEPEYTQTTQYKIRSKNPIFSNSNTYPNTTIYKFMIHEQQLSIFDYQHILDTKNLQWP
jgi:hypothetical protein